MKKGAIAMPLGEIYADIADKALKGSQADQQRGRRTGPALLSIAIPQPHFWTAKLTCKAYIQECPLARQSGRKGALLYPCQVSGT